eukprot:2399895-Pyramimonas_sp.AAC.1
MLAYKGSREIDLRVRRGASRVHPRQFIQNRRPSELRSSRGRGRKEGGNQAERNNAEPTGDEVWTDGGSGCRLWA